MLWVHQVSWIAMNKLNKKSKKIILSALALDKSIELINENKDLELKSLRLYLDGKGCDGFYYGVSFDDAQENDIHFIHRGIDLIVDPDTLEFVAGAVIDWVDDERGQGFLVDNPNARKYRGKFYKKENWQRRLKAKKTASTQHVS